MRRGEWRVEGWKRKEGEEGGEGNVEGWRRYIHVGERGGVRRRR